MTNSGSVAEISESVKQFYLELPFNAYSSPARAAESVSSANQIAQGYPDLDRLLRAGKIRSAIDCGCGAGWLAATLAYHYQLPVVGIDFNPVALKQGQELADQLGLDIDFREVNLLDTSELQLQADLVISIGVLHHTGAARSAFSQIVRLLSPTPDSRLYLGLYHTYGRKPFLDLFTKLRASGASDEQLFERYCQLHSQLTDQVHLRSWFRDQVLHPHETQHNLAELLEWLDQEQLQLESTSINGFERFTDTARLIEVERGLEAVSIERNQRQGRYFPGFFTVCAKSMIL